ncbi:YcxB family protein [Massilia sp. TSP1-1-2]|uniref:YcxB family protein n=1 Tax=Massilia sp. TSP1-1-2 TaxID=2804649 RepID=UPI003CE978AE
MSWFDQRTQLGDGSPVGGPLRRESVASTAVRGDAPDSGAPVAGPAPRAEELHFKVRYALPEYISFMWQHAGYLIRRRRIGRLPTWWLLAKSTAAAAMHFVVQGRSRHLYDFQIDVHGIIRTSNSGVTLVPWADVSAIRRYSRGYMMVLKRGTLPIPFRCLSGAQAGVMDVFAAAIRPARGARPLR